MGKKILFSFIILILFLVFGLLIYINNFLAPVTLKSKIISELEKKFQAKVRIENIRYNLFNGLIIQNIGIYQEGQNHPFISAKEINLNPLLLPLLHKKIIIPLVRIQSPNVYLELDKDKKFRQIEFSQSAKTAKEDNRFLLSILKISISEGELYFKDGSVKPDFTRQLTSIKIGAEIGLPRQIKFLIQAKIINTERNPSFLHAQGEYGLDDKKLNSNIKLNNFMASEYIAYLKNLPVLLAKGRLDAELNVKKQENLLDISGSINSKATVLRDEKFSFSGDLNIKPSIQYDLENKTAKYNGKVQIAQGKFVGLKITKEINEIQGDIYIAQSLARTTNLKAIVFDSPLEITGLLENFHKPLIKLKIVSNQVKLSSLTSLLSNPPSGLAVLGNARLVMNLDYNTDEPALKIKGIAQVNAVSLKLSQTQKDPFENIKGAVVFSNSGLNWPSMFFNYKQVSYKTTGALKDFKVPQINCWLDSRNLSLKSSLTIRDKLAEINNFEGKYLQSTFNAKGSFNIATSLIDINGEADLYLENIMAICPDNARQKLLKLKPNGLLKIEGTVAGSIKEPKNLETNLKLNSETFSIYGLKINNTRCSLKQASGLININDFVAKSYDGRINTQFSLDLNQSSPAYAVKYTLEAIDLAQLKNDTAFKGKDLSGILNIKGQLNGLIDNADALKGNGYLTVKNGKLWEINLFKGLGEFLFLPIYQKISFSDIDADFFIEDKKVKFANSFLSGKMMELATDGYIGFDGALDMEMHAKISKSLIEDSPDLRKFGSMIFGNLLNIKITGSLQKPQYKVLPFPKALFKEVQRFFQNR